MTDAIALGIPTVREERPVLAPRRPTRKIRVGDLHVGGDAPIIGFNAAGLIGPIIMGRIYSGTGAYSLAFIIALVFALLGFSLTFVYDKLNKK